MGLGIWGNRAGKAVILLAVAGVVGATGYLAGNGAAAPKPVVEYLPQPDFKPRTITVKNGTITSRLALDATIAAEPAVPVLPEKSGTVTKVLAKVGQYVGKGEAVVQFKYQPDTPEPTDPKKKPKTPKPQSLYLYATANGKVTELNAHVGSQVTAGTAAFSIDIGRFRAVATVESKNVYKLYNEPESIKLKIDHGPAPFNCALIDYGAGVGTKADKKNQNDDGNGMDNGDGGGGGTEVQVTCRVPKSKRVFAGLPAKMSILTDKATRVPVVPLSAVLGQSGNGFVTVVVDGKPERRAVRLGLNDGSMVEIRDGLEAGEKILDRAPQDPAFAGPGDEAPQPGKEPIMIGPSPS